MNLEALEQKGEEMIKLVVDFVITGAREKIASDPKPFSTRDAIRLVAELAGLANVDDEEIGVRILRTIVLLDDLTPKNP